MGEVEAFARHSMRASAPGPSERKLRQPSGEDCQWIGREGQVSKSKVQKATPHQGCSKVRPVGGRPCSAALKSEDRRPKPERRPKSEFREWPDSIGCCSAGVAINSDLGLRVSFGLRSSGLGFGMARTDFRAALTPHLQGFLLTLPKTAGGRFFRAAGRPVQFRHQPG